MRLLVDEMYPPAIAEQLRSRGHRVDAVAEQTELRNLSDTNLFAIAQQEGAAIVTENVRDFVPIARGCAGRGEQHFGLVLVDPSKYRRGAARTVGRMVTALDKLLGAVPSDKPTSLVHWL